MTYRYSVAVVTFRRPDTLRTVLESVASQSISPRITAVADNDPQQSAATVVQDLQADWPGELFYIPVGSNTGPAGGWAMAAGHLFGKLDERGDWLLVVDDDDPLQSTEVVSRLLSATAGRSNVGGVGLRGARLIRPRGRLKRVEPAAGEVAEVDYLASGGAPLYNWTALEQEGFFNSQLFFGFEDLDLGLRLRSSGWSILVAPQPDAHHVPDSSPSRSTWREYYKTRALIWTLRTRVGKVPAIVASTRSLLGAFRLGVSRHAVAIPQARVLAVVDAWRGLLGTRRYHPLTNPPKETGGETPGTPLRILFISGVDVGGAPQSTIELAHLLATRGHTTGVLLSTGDPATGLYLRLVKAAIKVRQSTGFQGTRTLLRPFGRFADKSGSASDVQVWRAGHGENALRHLVGTFKPDVVIASSFAREQMRWIHDDLRRLDVPFVIYMREEHSISHFTVTGLNPQGILANSQHLADGVPARTAHPTVAPSIITPVEVASERSAVLLINPVAENKPEILYALAAARADIDCVLQESWPLSAEHRLQLDRWCGELPNLSLRARTDDSKDVYRDARLVIAPYPSGRPRVVQEAQWNGIPVIAIAQPALVEAVGAGGRFLPPDASTSDWAAEIARVWDDAGTYTHLCEAAREHAQRDEMDPEAIVQRVEAMLREVTK